MAFYFCSKCGYGSASWMGRCPNCNEWNTFAQRAEEESLEDVKPLELVSLSKIQTYRKEFKKTGIYEFDRVIGGGLVPGQVILLTGEPGIGKSTLLLQSLKDLKTVYVSGEESAEQVKERATRLKIKLNNILFSNELQVEGIIVGVEKQSDKIDVLVIDSIQTVYSKNLDSQAGTLNQLKESTSKLIKLAKKQKLTVIIIGHITKEGDIAGPKTLEHFVDCVLSFEGEKVSHYRILRALKNRFASTEEIGIFEMKEKGLVEVNNPMAFLENQSGSAAGKTIVGVTEGKRILFFEIQTLAVSTVFAIPRRVVKGVDYNKVLLLIAVIQKQLGLPLERFDIYVNVVGGVSIKSTAADLGIVASLISSVRNVTLPEKTVFIGEVGLLGEIREVVFQEKIIQEARRMKFKNIFFSQKINNLRGLKKILF